jgi:drug/metabolite transporter (DMT)-like permease
LFLALSLMAYLFLSHGKAAFAQFRSIPVSALLISAACFAAGTTCYVTSLTYASTATVSVIGASSPLITAVLSPWLTKEHPHPLSWVAAILAMVGMVVIAKSGLELGHAFGLVLSLFVPLTFALQTLLLRRYRGFDMMFAICLGGLFSFTLCSIGSLNFGNHSAFQVSGHELLILSSMGFIQLALPLICYGWGAQVVPAITLSLIAMLDAVLNPFWTWAIMGEQPEASALIGGAIILAAVLLSILAAQVFARRAK